LKGNIKQYQTKFKGNQIIKKDSMKMLKEIDGKKMWNKKEGEMY
jgi:hypothetical protein